MDRGLLRVSRYCLLVTYSFGGAERWGVESGGRVNPWGMLIDVGCYTRRMDVLSNQ